MSIFDHLEVRATDYSNANEVGYAEACFSDRVIEGTPTLEELHRRYSTIKETLLQRERSESMASIEMNCKCRVNYQSLVELSEDLF